MPIHYTLHKFRPSETIDAVMRLKGRHSYTQAELVVLRKRFNELNGPVVPKVGDIFKIPLPEQIVDDFGELLDVTPAARARLTAALFSSVAVEVPVEPDPSHQGEEPAQSDHAPDPHQPVHNGPPDPVAERHPQDASQQHRDEQVAPNLGEQPSQALNDQVVEPAHGATLSVGGSRRRPSRPGS